MVKPNDAGFISGSPPGIQIHAGTNGIVTSGTFLAGTQGAPSLVGGAAGYELSTRSVSTGRMRTYRSVGASEAASAIVMTTAAVAAST